MLSQVYAKTGTRMIHNLFIPTIKRDDIKKEIKCPIVGMLMHICKNNCYRAVNETDSRHNVKNKFDNDTRKNDSHERVIDKQPKTLNISDVGMLNNDNVIVPIVSENDTYEPVVGRKAPLTCMFSSYIPGC